MVRAKTRVATGEAQLPANITTNRRGRLDHYQATDWALSRTLTGSMVFACAHLVSNIVYQTDNMASSTTGNSLKAGQPKVLS